MKILGYLRSLPRTSFTNYNKNLLKEVIQGHDKEGYTLNDMHLDLCVSM